MRYLVSLLTTLLFVIWILPLGVFIKPSQEKVACDGQRAICMCHHANAQIKSNSIEGFGLKSGYSSSNKESNASGGAGHYYLTANIPVQNILNLFVMNDSMFLAYRNPSLISIDHVPKV